MNLLQDQREKFQSLPEEPQLEFFTEPEEEPVVAEEPVPVIDETPPPEPEPFVPYKGKASKRNSGLTAAVLAFAILLLAAVVYFGYGAYRSLTGKEPQLAEETAPPTQLETEQPVQQQEQPPQRPAQQQTGVAAIGNIMGTILGAIPSGSRLSTLFLDDASFSVEITGNATALRSFQNDLKSGLPPETRLSNGSVTGGKTLVSGTFPRVGGAAAGQVVSKEQIARELNALCSQIGARVLESNVGSDVVSGGKRKAMLHFKIDGSTEQCRQVLEGFSQKNWNVEISKVILLPLTPQRANLVLRFLVIGDA